jgi:hypothetical protein
MNDVTLRRDVYIIEWAGKLGGVGYLYGEVPNIEERTSRMHMCNDIKGIIKGENRK